MWHSTIRLVKWHKMAFAIKETWSAGLQPYAFFAYKTDLNR